jgi:glycosyltransferase involved in cell wall biosynthesis
MPSNNNLKHFRILHFLSDGRVGGPGVRISREHKGLERISDGRTETIVACPTVQPNGYYETAGIAHVPYSARKPSTDRVIRSGLSWIAMGLLTDFRQCRSILEEIRPDVVHVNGAILAAPIVACGLKGVPALWRFDDVMVPQAMARAARTLAPLCGARIVATSNAVVRHYALPETTPVLYPPGPDLTAEPTPHTNRASGAKVGVLANVAPLKSIDTAITAVALLKETVPDVHLEIAGHILDTKYYYYEQLQDLISDLGLNDHVRFLGFVEDSAAWIRELDLLASPSVSESAGMAIIEAMALGVPAVAADIPASREIGGEAVSLFPPGDADALSEIMCLLLQDMSFRQERIRRGHDRAAAVFSADRIADQLFRLFTEITQS